MEKAKQLLDYLATYPNATIRFRASDMIMNVHSDASYLSESDARSRACGHFFMGWTPKDGNHIQLNGAFFTLCAILHFVVASAAEAELGALFLNCKEGINFRLTLEELGHPQPKTPIHCDNATAVGIANNTIKQQRSRSMEMRYFWVCNKVAQDAYDVKWHPGKDNLADYQSKHHPGAHHTAVCPWYLHEHNSPLVLPRASRPSTLKGCVGTLQQRQLGGSAVTVTAWLLRRRQQGGSGSKAVAARWQWRKRVAMAEVAVEVAAAWQQRRNRCGVSLARW